MTRTSRFAALLLVSACVLGLAPKAHAQSAAPSDYVIIAQNKITFGRVGFLAAGNIAVNDIGGQLVSGSQFVSGDGAHIVADSTSIGKYSSLYSLFTNDFKHAGIVTLRAPNQENLVPFPPPVLFEFPTVAAVTPGTVPVKVPVETVVTLPSGDYGDVLARKKSTIVFSGGTYNLRSLTAGLDSRILFAGPTQLNISQALTLRHNVVFGPLGTAMRADEIHVNFA